MQINSAKSLSNCEKWLNNLLSKIKMSTILLIYSFLIFCLTLSMLIICSNIQLGIARNQVQEISQQMLTLQNNKALNIQSQNILKILSFSFQTIATKMTKLSVMNYWSSLIDLSISQEIMPCQIAQQFDASIQQTFVCYSNSQYFQNKNIDKVQFIKLMNLLYINQHTFDFLLVSHEVYLVSFLDNFMTGYYPTKLQNETLEIVQQEWFFNYTIELQQSTQFIPYKLIPIVRMDNYDYLLSAFSMVLFDSKYMVGGVGSLLVNLRKIEQFVYVSSLSVILVYDTGVILYTKSFINQGIAKDFLYIYDENLTGFNESDWNDIKYSVNNSDQPVYKYNSLLKCNMYIKASQQPRTPLISLVLTNITYENEVIQVLDDEISKVLSQSTQTNLYIITIGIIIIMITLIPLKFIFISTNIVIDKMIRYLNGKFDYKLKDNLINGIELQPQNNSLNQLQFSYQKLDENLNQSQFKKSQQCIIFENFQFFKQQNIQLDISFQKLNNYNQQITFKQLVQLIKYPIEEIRQNEF